MSKMISITRTQVLDGTLFKQIPSAVALYRRKLHEPSAEFSRALKEGEKIIGYPTSFLNLRWLLSDEVGNVAMHLRKLMATNHPILKTAKELILQSETPSWGLIVLLLSKAAGLNSKFSKMDQDLVSGVLHSQRILAEVTEMIKMSNTIHRDLISIDPSSENSQALHDGNKIALICGDHLLSSSFSSLARLKNNELNELMSTALRDLSENEFIGPRGKDNRPFPAEPMSSEGDVEIDDGDWRKPMAHLPVLGNAKAEWTLRNILGGASLLGKACQGAMLLAGHAEEVQMTGYLFGKHFALASQAIKEITSIEDDGHLLSLISAPVMFHLQFDPSVYELVKSIADGQEHGNKLFEVVRDGPGIEATEKLYFEHVDSSLDELDKLPITDARTSLEVILHKMKT